MHRTKSKAAVAVFGCAALLVMAGCDTLLEVDLPSAVTGDALDDPSTANLQVNSVAANVECAYSSFAATASGNEDNFQRYVGVAGGYAQYPVTPNNGSCDGDAYSTEWVLPFLTAMGQGFDTWNNISGYAIANQNQLLAKLALYQSLTIGIFGEYFCEFAINAGPMLTYNQTLDVAEGWADSALAKIDAAVGAAGTFPINTEQGQVTSDLRMTVLGLRSRLKWANGDVAGAAIDAAAVTDGHMAWILREEGEDRRNMVSSYQGNGGGVQAAGFLQGQINVISPTILKGISSLGSHPVTGVAWPSPLPFTGYIDLAIDSLTGRAIDDSGNPLTLADADTEKDTRVQHAIGDTGGGPDYIIQKYTGLADDIPMINWREMRLIQAQNAGASSAGVDFVNAVRNFDGLPLVQGTYRTLVESDADRFEDLVIEERRRALWLEARYWSTKIQNDEKLWFPRAEGEWITPISTSALGGAVRMLMPSAEYDINPNLTPDDRATGCPAGQQPVGF